MTRTKDLLKALRATTVPARQLTFRETEQETPEGLIRLGLDDVGLPLLSIPISDDEPEMVDRTSQGFHLTTEDGAFIGQPRRVLLLRCKSALVEAPFISLCDDLLETLASSHSESTVKMVDTVLKRWRHLLAPSVLPRLTDPQLMGLLAELHLLEALAKMIGSDAAVNIWTGPAGSRHDFTGNTASVEVKATSARDQFSVSINGALQLEPAENGPLFLYAEQMEANPSGDSVTDAAERLFGLGVDAPSILNTLNDVGFHWQDSEKYRKARFSTLSSRFHEVNDVFPRIAPSTQASPELLEGIIRIQYTVNLEHVNPEAGDPLTNAVQALS